MSSEACENHDNPLLVICPDCGYEPPWSEEMAGFNLVQVTLLHPRQPLQPDTRAQGEHMSDDPTNGKRYWIQVGDNPEQEVSKEDFIAVEQQAGFNSKFGPNETATASFSNGTLKGRVEIVNQALAWEDTLRILRDEPARW